MTKVNQYRFNKSVNIQHKASIGISNGQQTFDFVNLYTNVRARKISPLRTMEKLDEKQPRSFERSGWLIRAEDRSVTANMRLVYNSENYYITGVREFKEDKLTLVLDTEKRDDE